jgi:hypothetical protein
MLVCVYNEVPYHYEVFGVFIEYALTKKWYIDVYYIEKEDGSTRTNNWVEFYLEVFNNDPKLNFININNQLHQMNYNAYDIVFMPTYSNIGEHIGKKCITVSHLCPEDGGRVPQNTKTTNISLRPFPCKLPWIHSCYSPVSVLNKPSNERLKLCLVGSLQTDTDIDIVKKIVKHNPKAELILINRTECHVLNSITPNIKQYNNVDAKQMMSLLGGCTYLLVPKTKDSKYIYRQLSGAIPIAISLLVPIIAPKKMIDDMNIGKIALPYDNDSNTISHLQNKVGSINMLEFRNECLNYTHETLNNLIPSDNPPGNKNMNIHFMWLTSDHVPTKPPEKYNKYIRTWKIRNPNANIYIWNDDDIRNMVSEYFPEHLKFYDSLEPVIVRCDWVKHIITWVHGGLYSDLDFYCLRNIDDLIPDNSECAFVREVPEHERESEHLCVGFFYAAKHLQLSRDWVNHIALTSSHGVKKRDILHITGPIAFYKFVEGRKYHLLNPCDIFPYTDHGKLSKICSESHEPYTVTIWNDGSGWGNEPDVSGTDLYILWIILPIVIGILLIIGLILYLKKRRII